MQCNGIGFLLDVLVGCFQLTHYAFEHDTLIFCSIKGNYACKDVLEDEVI